MRRAAKAVSEVYVSRLGHVLRDRRLGVSELQRRLRQRGHPVSRGALDRLVSERPVRTVDLDVLVPLLDELNVDFRSAFEKVPSHAVDVAAEARAAARRMARRTALDTADADLRLAMSRLEDELRALRPELFDGRGRLRRRRLERALAERIGGDVLEGDVLRALLSQDDGSPRADAT